MELHCLLSYKDRKESFHGITGGDGITAHVWEQILVQDHRSVQHATFSNDWTSRHMDHGASFLCLDTCQTISQLQNSDIENKERKFFNPTPTPCQHQEHSKASPRLTCSLQITYENVEIAWPSHTQNLAKAASTNFLSLPRAGILATV